MPQKILIVRLGSLGDVVLTSATITNLRLSFPDSYLVFLTKERFLPVVSMMSPVDEILALPQDATSLDYYNLLVRLDDGYFDLVVDLHGNFRSWLARKLVTANLKVTYPKHRLERWKIVKHSGNRAQVPHTIDSYNSALLGLEGGKAFCARPLLFPPVMHQRDADVIDASRATIVIAPGAAHANKQWPVERFAEVAVELCRRSNARIIWTVESEGVDHTDLDKRLPEGRFIQLAGQPIDRLAAVISKSKLVIANDSGVMHLASAVGTPTIGIFGPTHPSLGFAPRGLFDRIVEVEEPCRPCSFHGKTPCYREQRFCLTRIEPELIAEHALDLLQTSSTRSPALFVDRDGTIIEDRHYLSNPSDVQLLPRAADGLAEARRKGYKIVIVSNQSGVARGYFPLEVVHQTHQRLKDLLEARGVVPDGIYFCPHFEGGGNQEFALPCNCRKPKAGMAEQAAIDLSLDLRRSVVIGDKVDDLCLGAVIGAVSIGVRTGHGEKDVPSLAGFWRSPRARLADDLYSAVQLLPKLES